MYKFTDRQNLCSIPVDVAYLNVVGNAKVARFGRCCGREEAAVKVGVKKGFLCDNKKSDVMRWNRKRRSRSGRTLKPKHYIYTTCQCDLYVPRESSIKL